MVAIVLCWLRALLILCMMAGVADAPAALLRTTSEVLLTTATAVGCVVFVFLFLDLSVFVSW